MNSFTRTMAAMLIAIAVSTALFSAQNPTDGKKTESPPAAPQNDRTDEVRRLIKDLEHDRFVVREKAMKALEQVGEPALKHLEEASRSSSLEVQKRARILVERIKKNAALAPTAVRLTLKDVPVPKAVEALAKQTRFKLELVPQQGPARIQLDQKRITLQLENAVFWEALEKLCAAAGLTYVPSGADTFHLEAYEGAQRSRVPTAARGAFRFRVVGMNYFRNVNFLAASGQQSFGPANVAVAMPFGGPFPMKGVVQPMMAGGMSGANAVRQESLTVTLDVLAEPHVRIYKIGAPELEAAEDETGQSLITRGNVTSTSGYGPQSYQSMSVMQPLTTVAMLRPSTKPAAKLKWLKGHLPIDVMAQRQPCVQVDNILNVKGKIYKGTGGVTLVLLQVQQHGPQNGNIRFAITGLEKTLADIQARQPNRGYLDGNMFRPFFEITDAQGHPYQTNLNLNYNPNPADEGLLDGNMYYNPGPNTGPPARLVFYDMKLFHAKVPFEFRDVTMP
jgi:hypothetical protein